MSLLLRNLTAALTGQHTSMLNRQLRGVLCEPYRQLPQSAWCVQRPSVKERQRLIYKRSRSRKQRLTRSHLRVTLISVCIAGANCFRRHHILAKRHIFAKRHNFARRHIYATTLAMEPLQGKKERRFRHLDPPAHRKELVFFATHRCWPPKHSRIWPLEEFRARGASQEEHRGREGRIPCIRTLRRISSVPLRHLRCDRSPVGPAVRLPPAAPVALAPQGPTPDRSVPAAHPSTAPTRRGGRADPKEATDGAGSGQSGPPGGIGWRSGRTQGQAEKSPRRHRIGWAYDGAAVGPRGLQSGPRGGIRWAYDLRAETAPARRRRRRRKMAAAFRGQTSVSRPAASRSSCTRSAAAGLDTGTLAAGGHHAGSSGRGLGLAELLDRVRKSGAGRPEGRGRADPTEISDRAASGQ